MQALLRKIIETVADASDLNEAMRCLVSKTKESLRVDCCSVYLADPSRNRMVLAATDGLRQECVGTISLAEGEGLVGLVADSREVVNLADARNHPNFKYIPEVGEESFKSFLGVPLIDQRKILGVLVIHQSAARKFDESDESFLVTLAAQLSAKIAKFRLEGELEAARVQSGLVTGIAVSPGVAVAPAFVWRPMLNLEQVALVKTDDPLTQVELFRQAVFQVQLDLDTIMMRVSESSFETGYSEQNAENSAEDEASDIFEIYSMMLNDDEFSSAIEEEISSGHWMAVSAVRIVCERYIEKFQSMEDEYQKERAIDVHDIAQRLLSRLAHNEVDGVTLSSPFVLVAEEVTVSLLAELPRNLLKGMVSVKGAANSHAGILARNLGIPAVMGASLPIGDLSGKTLVVDGSHGHVIVSPDAAVKEEFNQLILREAQFRETAEKEVAEPTFTKDGEQISVRINAGLRLGKQAFFRRGLDGSKIADGVGLYRTEIAFMLQPSFPTEDEQVGFYSEFLSDFRDVPVCMRTLDIGGDKPLPYFAIDEDNPGLGWRGIRLTLDNPTVFMTQLRAMLRANIDYGNLYVMLPMVSSVGEIIESKKLLEQAHREISEEFGTKEKTVPMPKLGVMIEVPSMIFALDEMARYVDFFSIGTNDLVQYILAVDRNNDKVASHYNPYDVAVQRALAWIKKECDRLEKPVSVCGEFAGEPMGVLLLLAHGYRKFSMNLASVARIKYLVRRVDVGEIRKIVENTGLSDWVKLREKLTAYMNDAGLGCLASKEENT